MIDGITPFSPSKSPNIQRTYFSYGKRKTLLPTPPVSDEEQSSEDEYNFAKKIKSEQENYSFDLLTEITPSQFKIHRLAQPRDASGTMPDIVDRAHLKKQQLLLNNLTIHKLLYEYNYGHPLNQKISRKNTVGLPYSVNLVQDPQNPDKAYLIIHYRNRETNSKFYSAKEAHLDADKRTKKSGVFAEGGTSDIRIAQTIPVIKKDGAWALEENYAHYFGVRKVSKKNKATALQNEGEKTRLLGMHPDDFPILDYKQGNKQVVLMPYLSGQDLMWMVSDNRIKDNHIKLSIIRDILNHLLFIYKKGYVYRDLKLENVLCDEISFRAKIIDFGFAAKSEEINRTELFGTTDYLPNELLNASEYNYNLASDFWALGRLIKFLLGALATNEDGSFKISTHFIKTPQGKTGHVTKYVCVETREEFREIIGKEDPLAEKLFDIANYFLDYQKHNAVPAEQSIQHLEKIIRGVAKVAQKYKPEQQPGNTVSANTNTSVATTNITQVVTQCPCPTPKLKAQSLP